MKVRNVAVQGFLRFVDMDLFTSKAKAPKCRVVIVGAGPAGLLAAINFLRREGPVQYVVDLVESGEDYGLLDAAGLEKERSWQIGLSTHGLAALRRVPGLSEDISQVGVQINQTSIFLGAKEIKTGEPTLTLTLILTNPSPSPSPNPNPNLYTQNRPAKPTSSIAIKSSPRSLAS